ncbi:hypothetical protein HAHI6034_07470 [Hathewaya histolytica]|uniref:Uncharacterized protein n=1 Tax=Hathewaya histolytica TaxID=1498 RepID=A0A4U9QVU4_HATHI|nr:hypothetical protein [Hathewaya histolytica]VTQ82796.1 Uncharacterised protein [Hathewaya histolytica]
MSNNIGQYSDSKFSKSEVLGEEVYDTEYVPFVIKWGQRTNIGGAILSFLPALLLLFVFKIKPSLGPLTQATVAQLSASFAYYFVDPIAFFPVLGLTGTYMAFLTGNISNLRLPCAINALESAGVKPGTKKASIISTLGIASSVVVNTTMLTIGVFVGAKVIGLLPPAATAALKYLVPAIFGAVFVQLSFYDPKIGIIAISIAVVMTIIYRLGLLAFFPGDPSYVITLASVFGTIFVSKTLHSKGKL